MSASFWLLLAPLLTGGFVGLLVAFLLEGDSPVAFFVLLGCALLVLLLRFRLASAGARARILCDSPCF